MEADDDAEDDAGWSHEEPMWTDEAHLVYNHVEQGRVVNEYPDEEEGGNEEHMGVEEDSDDDDEEEADGPLPHQRDFHSQQGLAPYDCIPDVLHLSTSAPPIPHHPPPPLHFQSSNNTQSETEKETHTERERDFLCFTG